MYICMYVCFFDEIRFIPILVIQMELFKKFMKRIESKGIRSLRKICFPVFPP